MLAWACRRTVLGKIDPAACARRMAVAAARWGAATAPKLIVALRGPTVAAAENWVAVVRRMAVVVAVAGWPGFAD